MPADDEVKKFQ